RHSFSPRLLAAAGEDLAAVCSGASAHLGAGVSPRRLLATGALVDPGIRYSFSHINILADEYFLPTPSGDVLDLYRLESQISTENADKYGLRSDLVVLNFVGCPQKGVVLSLATLNIVGPPLKENSACQSHFGFPLSPPAWLS